MPPQAVLDEIARLVDLQKLEDVLMAEGIKKFADPQKALLALIDASGRTGEVRFENLLLVPKGALGTRNE